MTIQEPAGPTLQRSLIRHPLCERPCHAGVQAVKDPVAENFSPWRGILGRETFGGTDQSPPAPLSEPRQYRELPPRSQKHQERLAATDTLESGP